MKTEPNAPIVPMKHANGQQMGHDAETTHFLECTNAYIGLTKREEFAKAAMIGYCGGEYIGQSGMAVERIAEWCVSMADALIVELNKYQNPDTNPK